MNNGDLMENITVKTNDATNIVHRYYFHTRLRKKSQMNLEQLAPVSPTIATDRVIKHS
jgi:hypothetical protein